MTFRGRLLLVLVWCLMDMSLLIFPSWTQNGCCNFGLHAQGGSRRKQRSTKGQELLAIYTYIFLFSCVLFKEYNQGFPGGAVVENPPANAGDTGSSPGLGRSHMPQSSWAREPQLLRLHIWSLCSATREATIARGPCTAMKSGPHLPQLETALTQKRRPNTAINK